ncbi:MAG TPA: aldehyde ferredoxin oxidoreductase family protein [Bacteroidota bacterium]|nr:aldehyde ferredoxin oxidoreductase family protein [Bacteroidota bacterium]
MYGWTGTILRVDLTSGRIEEKPLSKELRYNYIGGRGVNSRILYDEVKPGTDALSPENVLIFGTGPITGLPVASGRLTITAVSPLNNLLGDANGGSHFSPELKFAGYDHIVFTGKAAEPVYLWIENDKVELKAAKHLWGKLTDETQETIKQDLGDPRVQISCIGPAGENLVRLAVVIVGSEGCCARCGMGAVMGSKNLKAVAVRGTRGVQVPDPQAVRDYFLNMKRRMMSNRNYPAFSTYGTKYFFSGRHFAQGLGMKNSQETGSFRGYDQIKAETLREKYVIKDKACYGCVNHCRDWFEIKEGPYAGLSGVGIELAEQESWGSLLDNDYAPSIYKAHILGNQYGIDTMECAEVIAAATEWYQKGLITKEDTQGIELDWGNYEALLAMLPKIARREGIGDLLAEDAIIAAKKLGPEAQKSITHFKGVLKTNWDLRTVPTYTFAHAVSTRGGDHLRGALPLRPLEKPGDYEGVANQVHSNTYECTIADALELCKFSTPFLNMELKVKDMVPLFEIATGIKITDEEMRKIADRIWTLERSFQVRAGVTRKDDAMVGRFMNERVPDGPYKGLGFTRKDWDKMLDEYYDLVGWDKKTGIPTRATLESLELGDVADELERLGKLK